MSSGQTCRACITYRFIQNKYGYDRFSNHLRNWSQQCSFQVCYRVRHQIHCLHNFLQAHPEAVAEWTFSYNRGSYPFPRSSNILHITTIDNPYCFTWFSYCELRLVIFVDRCFDLRRRRAVGSGSWAWIYYFPHFHTNLNKTRRTTSHNYSISHCLNHNQILSLHLVYWC